MTEQSANFSGLVIVVDVQFPTYFKSLRASRLRTYSATAKLLNPQIFVLRFSHAVSPLDVMAAILCGIRSETAGVILTLLFSVRHVILVVVRDSTFAGGFHNLHTCY